MLAKQLKANRSGAADPVLKGLGGASQEDQQPVNVLKEKKLGECGPHRASFFGFSPVISQRPPSISLLGSV